jgi:hypothetical protein
MAIKASEADVGRIVGWDPKHDDDPETGTLEGINGAYAYVRFGDNVDTRSCRQKNLRFVGNRRAETGTFSHKLQR